MVDYKLIGSRLKLYRENQRLTQEMVAERADITSVYLSKIENGRVRPTLDTLSSICLVLNCDLGAIFLDSLPASNNYQSEKIVQIFNSCSPQVKPVALDLLERLSKL